MPRYQYSKPCVLTGIILAWGGVKLPIIVSRNVKFMELGGSVHFVGKHGRVFLGFGSPGVADRKREKMLFQNSGEIIFKGKCSLSTGCKIINSGSIIFGDDFAVKARSTIISDCNIKFGDHVLISWDCLIMDTDMHIIIDQADRIINHSKPVYIGDNVWIGCRTTILKGVNIMEGNVIGAGSVIRRELNNKNCVYINEVPIKENIQWKK